MKSRDYEDLIGGALMFVLGIFFAVYARNYDLGTLARMGPGYFPTALGVVLAVLGVLIFLPALKREGVMPEIQWRNVILTLGGIVVFAFTLRNLGLVVACLSTVIIVSLADRETTWRLRLILAVSVTLITVLIFKVGLGMVIPIWWWGQ